jgi:mitochondrial chaperone BCS1
MFARGMARPVHPNQQNQNQQTPNQQNSDTSPFPGGGAQLQQEPMIGSGESADSTDSSNTVSWKQQLQSNPYFSAGFGLIGVGAVLSVARSGAAGVWAATKRHLYTSLEIPSKDKSYAWFMEWMAKHEHGNHRKHVSLSTTFQQFENGEIRTQSHFIPGAGNHIIRYGGRFIFVAREREKTMVDFTTGTPWETVTLTTVGSDGRPVFDQLLTEAREQALVEQEASTVVYTTSGGQDWRRFGQPRKRKPLGSVVLAEGQQGRIVGDVREFLETAKWYAERGIPHRRGYLLYGPPGTGKSSFITALAGELRLNICVLNLHSRGISDDTLSVLLNNAPQRSIILLEDIDATLGAEAQSHTPQRVGSSAGDGSSSSPRVSSPPVPVPSGREGRTGGVTFSGLLNALDGVVATEGGGRIVFMTTNHPERLPAALVRPGRVDVKEEFGMAAPEQAEGIFRRFFTGGTETGDADMAKAFARVVPPGRIPMAALQGLLLAHKHDPEAALAAAAEAARLEHGEALLDQHMHSFAATSSSGSGSGSGSSSSSGSGSGSGSGSSSSSRGQQQQQTSGSGSGSESDSRRSEPSPSQSAEGATEKAASSEDADGKARRPG